MMVRWSGKCQGNTRRTPDECQVNFKGISGEVSQSNPSSIPEVSKIDVSFLLSLSLDFSGFEIQFLKS